MDYIKTPFTSKMLLSLLMAGSISGAYAESSIGVLEKSLPVINQSNGSVTGVVTDEMGPVIGASVVVKGTTNGTVTDMDGKFTISGVSKGAVLQISYVGYQTQEVVWNGRGVLNIQLQSDSQDLDEVVVVAYGTTKKSSFTGSASVVKSEQLEKISGTGFAEALQGMSAGVNVSNNEGNPGGDTRIQIRGISSMSGQSSPLIIVDGMPYDGSLNTIAPTDIESMTVLKDAAAASLYGSRAANGVVVVTTKKGKSGKPTLNFRGAWGTSDNAVKNPVKADPYQQLTNTWQAIYNDKYCLEGLDPKAAGDYASQTVLGHMVNPRVNSKGETVYVTPFKWTGDASNYVLHDGNGNGYVNPNLEMVWDESDYDWYGAVFSRKLRQDYGIDLSGATENGKTQYFTSLSFLDDKGYANQQYYKRYSFRANVTSEITNWLQMGGSLAYSYYRQNNSGANRALVFSNTLNSPWLRNEDNTAWYTSQKTGERIYDFAENSANFFGIHVLNNAGDYWNNPNDDNFDNYDGNMVTAHYFADFKLPFDLKFKTAVNLDDITKSRYTYDSAIHGEGQMKPYGVTVRTSGGSASRSNWRTTSLTWNNVLNWDKTFGDNTFNVMLGHELYSYNKTYNYSYGEGIMQMDQYELSSTTTNWATDSWRNRYTLLSFFGKIDYNYMNKYYLSASMRRDGSSRFHPDSRWGNFFSVGASWRLSKEKFLEDQTWIDNLSLRGSYGTSGNDKLIPRNTSSGYTSADEEILYAYQGYYMTNPLYGQAGYKPKTMATPDLKWEKNEQYNVAVDFSFWNRFNGTIEFYTRNSKDLLYYKQLPLSAQIGDANGYNTNLGNIRNRGIEITLGATAIKTNDFQWNVDFNLSTLKNEVTYLPDGAYTYSSRGAGYKLDEGHSIFEFFMVKNAGVNPENGNMRYWIQDGNGGWKTTEKYSDVTVNDYQWCGTAIPTVFGSLTNTFKYKDFDLSFMWYASFGSYMWDYQYLERTTVRDGVGVIQDLVEGKVWQKPGDNAEFPRWSASNYGDTRRNSDFYLFKNNYWRLRNLTFGYTLPRQLTRKVGISNARVYLSGDNLWTLGAAAKRHTEPETGMTGNNYNGNADTDNGVQGSRRVYMAGIQVTF